MSVGVAASSNWHKAPATTLVPVHQQAAQAPTSAAARQTPVRNVPARPAQSAAAAPAGAPADYHQLVTKYCVSCHSEKLKTPVDHPLNLEVANLDDPVKDAATWERVIRKLGQAGTMPPATAPQPGLAKLAEFRSWLIDTLDKAEAGQTVAGKFVLHRLNRTEYANAVRDLLAINVDVAQLLPSDGGDFGFDNIATALPTSPLLLERYLTAAMQISDLAVGDTTVAPGAAVYPISLEVTQREHVPGLPLGTRGGILIHHVFPTDADYLLSVRLNRTILNGYSGIQGNEKPQQYIVLVDGKQVFTEKVGGPDDHKMSVDDVNKAAEALDQRLKVRIPITAGPHDVGFTWLDKPEKMQDDWQPSMRDTQEVHMAGGVPRIRAGVIEGPYNATGISNTPSRERIFVCRPTSAADESACAQRIVSTLTRRAFRRPVTADDTESPLAFYAQERKRGGDFDAGIRQAVARILASPSFLYRSEADPETVKAGGSHQVSDVELASRLSFFLWSSIPDNQLLNLAAAGRLREPGMLATQVKRMLADERSDSMIENFVGQWLQVRNLESRVTPDILLFPDFDDNVRKAFRTESEMFFGSIVRENQSALRLLDADYTFVDERLAKHYGIPNVYGTRFRRVQIPDPNRRGLLGEGSLLSLTAIANRTSPTIRGKYVLSVLLNTPPPPPLPSVPALDKSAVPGKAMTVRQQVEAHRANPVCSSCHRNIDPVGFALENFDSVGVWRDKTADGLPIDAAGVLPDGTQVNGPVQLREALLKRPEVFVGALTENLMIYALGRGLEPADMPIVRKIVRTAAQNNYKLQSIIMGIVQSAPFQMRTKLSDNGSVARAN
jgi:mono/diheme cytochrome c family protein